MLLYSAYLYSCTKLSAALPRRNAAASMLCVAIVGDVAVSMVELSLLFTMPGCCCSYPRLLSWFWCGGCDFGRTTSSFVKDPSEVFMSRDISNSAQLSGLRSRAPRGPARTRERFEGQQQHQQHQQHHRQQHQQHHQQQHHQQQQPRRGVARVYTEQTRR
ncbi:unnamed protein product [Lampetra fluviatilis]